MFTEALQGEYGNRGLQAMTLCPGGTASNFAGVAGNQSTKDAFDNMDTPEFVAETGLEAFLKGDLYVITGQSNKRIALLPRLLTRKRVLKIAGETWKKRLDSAGLT